VTEEAPMAQKAVLLASIVTTVAGSTPVVSKRRCSDASLLTWHDRSERYAAETHGQYMLENQGLTFELGPHLWDAS
jgi:hypothetical protein